jgi:hypothetical protein
MEISRPGAILDNLVWRLNKAFCGLTMGELHACWTYSEYPGIKGFSLVNVGGTDSDPRWMQTKVVEWDQGGALPM